MIRVCLLIFTFFVPTVLLAEMSDVRRNTLINICDTAQKSSDLGTIRNIGARSPLTTPRTPRLFVLKPSPVGNDSWLSAPERDFIGFDRQILFSSTSR